MLWGISTKWWVIGGVAALVVSSLGVHTTLSYLKTLHRGVGETVRDLTPIEFDLKRLKTAIDDIEPQVRAAQKALAELDVAREYVQKDVARLEQTLRETEQQMRQVRAMLGQQLDSYVVSGTTYSRTQLENDLARRLDRFEELEAELNAKKEILKQQDAAFAAAEKKVLAFQRQKDQLLAQAERLRAELDLVRSQQAAGQVRVDDSRVAEAQKLAEDVEKRIKVLQRTTERESRDSGLIDLPKDERPAIERFDARFGKQQGT